MPDDSFEVEISLSDPEFFQALENPAGLMPFLSGAMENILDVYQAVAEGYPPESDANRPGRVDQEGNPVGYYERGRGWWSPRVGHKEFGLDSKFPSLKPNAKAPYTMGAMSLLATGFIRVTGYKLTPSSQQLHDRWVRDVEQAAQDVLGRLRNMATYSSYVQGLDQIPLHAARDWQTVEENWNRNEVQSTVNDETNQAIDRYYGLNNY